MSTRLGSAHARYRERLAALDEPGAVQAALADACESLGRPQPRSWERVHERFEPNEEPFATFVYLGAGTPPLLDRVEAFTSPPGVRLRVTPLRADPALPALAAVLAGPGRRTVVRYHPGRRCTIRVDRDGSGSFAKLYADGRGEHVHRAALALWRAAGRGELGFRVARSRRFDPATRTVWQEPLAGAPVRERLRGGDGEELAYRIGRAAASLARARIRPRAVRDARTELERSARRCAELERRVPALGADASRLLARLAELHAASGARRPRPVHGALHASQWLDDGSRLGVVDYDSLALGDPELDAATFLAGLDVENRERTPVERLAERFLAGHESAGDPLDPLLLRAYRAHRLLEKALRVARAVRPDGDEKAERRLRRALECAGGVA